MNKRGTVRRTTPFPRANWLDEHVTRNPLRGARRGPRRRGASMCGNRRRLWLISLKTTMATKRGQERCATFSSFTTFPSSCVVLWLASSPIRTSRPTASGVTNSKSGGGGWRRRRRGNERTNERQTEGQAERALTSWTGPSVARQSRTAPSAKIATSYDGFKPQ